MSDVSTLVVNLVANDTASAVLARLDSQLIRASASADRAAQALGGRLASGQQQVTAEDIRAANAALANAAAQARYRLALGDTAGALSIYRNALQNSSVAGERNITAIQTSIARLETGRTSFQQFGDSAKSSLLGLVGPAAAAAAAFGILREGLNIAVEGFKLQASLDASKKSIDLLLSGVRDTGTVWADATRFANTYKLTQRETTEAIQASVRIIRTSKASIEDVLGAFARLKVLAPEKTFQDASRALSELQAGQVVSIEHLFNVPRRDANEMKKEIEGGADAVVVLNKFLDKTGVTMGAVKAQSEGAAGALKELAQEQERLALAASGGAGGPGLAILKERITLERGLANVLSGNVAVTNESSSAFNRYAGVISAVTGNFALMDQAAIRASAAETQTAAAAEGVTVAQNAMAAAIQAAAAAASRATPAMVGLTDGLRNTHEAAAEDAAMLQLYRSAADDAKDATDRSVLSLSVHAQQSLQAALETKRFTDFQATLASLGGQVAHGLQTDAQAAAILSQQYGIASGEALRLIGLQAQLAGSAVTVSDASDRAFSARVAQNVHDTKAAADAVAAQHAQVLAVGTHQQKVAELRAEYERLSRVYGANSAEAINAQTKLLQETDKKQKGAARTRLSDQTRLNNQLLAADTKFNQQEEDATAAHERKVLDIEAEFQKKSLEQQHANEVAKRQSRADFYDNLTQATKDVGPKEAQALSAAYEAAYAKAQEIAASGQQKLAADYLAFKQKEIQDELEFQKKLAEAKKNKDSGEVARLQAIHELRQQAADEEEKQLLAGGDANANARDAALADETSRFAEAQDKISTASDRSTDRLVANAERAGKKITTDLIPPLERAAAAADRVGAKTGPAAPAPTGGAAPAGTPGTPATPATGTPGAPIDLSALADALHAAADQISTAVGAVEAATKAGSRDTVSAIKGLNSKLVQA